jgi:hypothetical protein
MTHEPSVTAQVLTEPGWEVPAVSDGPPGSVAWLRAHVVRFSRGAEHPPRRAIVFDLLAALDPTALGRQARELASRRRHAGQPDVTTVPVDVLAAALGGSDVDSADVLALSSVYLPPAEPNAEADAAVARLVRAFGGGHDELTAHRVALLAQTCAATAALIDRSAAHNDLEPDEAIRRTLAEDPPARATRRTNDAPVRLAGHDLPAGSVVRVDLTGTPFGAGAHACPGQAHALAMARGVLEALR